MKKGEISDLTGQKFNMLTAIKYVGKDKQNKSLWLFKCACGKEIIKRGSSIKAGSQQSCGCLKSHSWEKQLKNGNLGFCQPSHNMSKTRIYSIWHGMKRRCKANINSKKLKNYINITYYNEWENFEPFYDWAIQNGYTDGLTLDRIDNTRGYYPDNCRWVTAKEQCNNRTNNRMISYKGETLNISQWCEKYPINRRHFYNLIKKGYSDEDALSSLLSDTL